MEKKELSLYIAIIAQAEIEKMAEDLSLYKDKISHADSKEVDKLKHHYNDSLVGKHKHVVNILKQMSEPVLLNPDETEENTTPAMLHSQSLVLLSKYARFVDEDETAYQYAEKAFNLHNNQTAKYLMALSKFSFKVKATSFSKSKNQAIIEEHNTIVKKLFIETIKMDPFSAYGIDAGNYLIQNFDYQFTSDEL